MFIGKYQGIPVLRKSEMLQNHDFGVAGYRAVSVQIEHFENEVGD